MTLNNIYKLLLSEILEFKVKNKRLMYELNDGKIQFKTKLQ